MDSTVKTLYGHQEGAEVGYNPHKPGRPSHAYHTYLLSSVRLMMGVDVRPLTSITLPMPPMGGGNYRTILVRHAGQLAAGQQVVGHRAGDGPDRANRSGVVWRICFTCA